MSDGESEEAGEDIGEAEEELHLCWWFESERESCGNLACPTLSALLTLAYTSAKGSSINFDNLKAPLEKQTWIFITDLHLIRQLAEVTNLSHLQDIMCGY